MVIFRCPDCNNVDICQREPKNWECPTCNIRENMKNKPLPCSECREQEKDNTLGFILDDLTRLKISLEVQNYEKAMFLLGCLMTYVGHKIVNAENQ